MKFLSTFLILLARLSLATLFVVAGISKFLSFDQTASYMSSKGLPMVPVLLTGAAILELVGGLAIAFGYKARLASLLLIVFLVFATLLFHDFWNLHGAEAIKQQTDFLKNLAIVGGLLYVFCYGTGNLAIDHSKRLE